MRLRRFYPAGVLLLVLLALGALFHGAGSLYFGPADSDLTNVFYLWRVFLVRWLRRGVLPLWDPHVFDGYPVIEIQQMGVLYPVTLFTSLLLSARVGLITTMALHLGIAAGGAWLGLRRGFGLSRGATALGTLSYVFGAVFSTRVTAGHVTVVAVMAWWPWALSAFYRVLRMADRQLDAQAGGWRDFGRLLASRRPVRLWLLVAVLAQALSVLAGAPQYVVYLFYMQALMVLTATRRRLWAQGGCCLRAPGCWRPGCRAPSGCRPSPTCPLPGAWRARARCTSASWTS